MEAAIISEGMQKIYDKYNLKPIHFIGDGDSSTYS